MDRRMQHRFYDVSGCYLDDERLAAWAVAEFCDCGAVPEMVYRDLLAGRYTRWIDQLEAIADNTLHKILNEWCKQKQFELDMMGDNFWSPGDARIIECNGWKLCPGGNRDEED